MDKVCHLIFNKDFGNWDNLVYNKIILGIP